MPSANVRFEIEQSATYGGNSYRQVHEADGVDVQFGEPFCSLHPNGYISNGHCDNCDTHFKEIALNRVRGVTNYIPCSALDHIHDCKCFLGHECHDTCESAVPKTAHALEQLAGAAPAPEMQSVYDRLQSLEQDNAALKNLVTKLLSHLPKELVEAAAMDAIREKIGVAVEGSKNETVGSTESIQNA